ncbi:MAG TPA: ROK family protein [Patescibacteria group bacterium]|nr:ROK family protein [Patescibacteria group bacterium]
MYLGVDVGGTKTLLAAFSPSGELLKTAKFPTDKDYDNFVKDLAVHIPELDVKDFLAGCVALPGRIDRKNGRGVKMGNLDWRNFPIAADLEKIIGAPVTVENDAKAGALSEALIIIKEFKKSLFITIGTGIGVALITNGVIDIDESDSGGNSIMLEHQGRIQSWESFASGKAITEQFGKKAEDITDESSWKIVAHNLALGIINLIAIMQPDVIIIGGGVGHYYDHFAPFLDGELKKFQTPLTPIPPIHKAQRPEEAVIYGCYELAKARYGKAAS